MKRPCKDLAWIRFWSINEFEPVDPGNTRIKIKQHEVKWVRARFLIRFCDALVECPVYALNLDPDDAMNGEVLECGDFTQVAGSIEGFIEMVTSMNEASLPPL